jgi:biopolymer transport protein ExbD
MSFTSETRERSRPVLPLAGMVDILFLLLVFFITASSLKEQEAAIPLELTPAESAQVAARGATPSVINIKDNGEVYWGGGASPISLPALRQKLQQLSELPSEETVLIRGDKNSNFGLFVRVTDMAKQAGIAAVDIAAARPGEAGESEPAD